jgi:hypothetical protein
MTQQALERLADRSALLNPPANEMPELLVPEEEAQQRMLNAMQVYVMRVLSHLPDFFAQRNTTKFDDAPVTQVWKSAQSSTGLHLVGSSSREITFRDGRDVFNGDQNVVRGVPNLEGGLESQGEFGTETGIVLSDLANGTIFFHGWEQVPAGVAAVYSYHVPKSVSHYEVNYACSRSHEFTTIRAITARLPSRPRQGQFCATR